MPQYIVYHSIQYHLYLTIGRDAHAIECFDAYDHANKSVYAIHFNDINSQNIHI